MIKTETFYIGEKEFVRTWSDRGMMIHGGSPEADYEVAEDPAELNRTYTETDIPVEDELTNDEILAILLGEGEEE